MAEETKLQRYTSFARICVYMHLNKALPDKVSINHEDVEWVQLIDYEHVPFRCRRCHALGHLYRDCPLTQNPSTPFAPEKPEYDDFTKATSHRSGHKKPMPNPKFPQASTSQPSTSTVLML